MLQSLLLSIVLLFSPNAQTCGSGLPCGPLPWQLPSFPSVSSPTPIPTVIATASLFTATPTVTGTPPTAVPTPTATSPLDLSGVDDHLATIQGIAASTPSSINGGRSFDLGANAGSFWPYMMGLGQIHFGIFTPLIQFAIFALLFIVGIRVALMMLPLIGSLVGIIRKIVQTVLDFIPG